MPSAVSTHSRSASRRLVQVVRELRNNPRSGQPIGQRHADPARLNGLVSRAREINRTR